VIPIEPAIERGIVRPRPSVGTALSSRIMSAYERIEAREFGPRRRMALWRLRK
jgi:hypothetical protein